MSEGKGSVIELLRGLKSQDEKSQTIFWKQYRRGVYAICASILGPGPDATDVSADLLSDFLSRYVHQLSNAGALGSYLRLMAVRRSLRVKNRRSKQISIDHDSLEDDDVAAPDEAAAHALLMPKLGVCLQELTPKAQETLRLKYKRQWTNERIGSVVGGSKQYIGRLITESLNVLRKCIERGGSPHLRQSKGAIQ